MVDSMQHGVPAVLQSDRQMYEKLVATDKELRQQMVQNVFFCFVFLFLFPFFTFFFVLIRLLFDGWKELQVKMKNTFERK
jgi:hypothetical protein